MSDAVWYYAQNEQEKGPVTTAELRTLAASGKLKPVDLVWKDGMGDWTAAAQIKGLMPEPPAPPEPKAKPQTQAKSQPQAKSSESGRAAVAPNNRDARAGNKTPTSDSPRDARWIDGPPAEDSSPSGVQRVPTAPVTTRAGAARTSPATSQQRRAGATPSTPTDVMRYARHAGMALTAVGLLLVLGGKGCDMLSGRYAARVSAMARAEEARFQQETSRQRLELETLITQLQPDPRQSQRLSKAEADLQTLEKTRREQEQKLIVDRWADLRAAAATASDDNRAWGFWRGVVIVFGALILTPGLMLVGVAGQGPERWMALAMLAVVVFSLFVSGAAWNGPLLD